MGRIIITESQANMLKLYLFESAFGPFTRQVRVSDELNIKMNNVDYEFKVISIVRNKPVMELMINNQPHNTLYYLRSFSSPINNRQPSIYMGTADRQRNLNNLSGATTWRTTSFNVESIELLRGGNVINSVDIINPQQQQQNQSGSTQSNTGSTATTQTIIASDIINNPILKKAYYEPDSPLKAFLKGLAGKKLSGKGIIVARQRLDKFYMSDYGLKLGNANFIQGKQIKFNPDDDVTISYSTSGTTAGTSGSTGSYTFDKTTEFTSTVGARSIGSEFKLKGSIARGSLFYIIKIIKKEDSRGDDVYKGILQLYRGTQSSSIRLNILNDPTIYIKIIRGSDSPGYNPQQSQSTP